MNKVLYTLACLSLLTIQAIANVNPAVAGTPATSEEEKSKIIELIPDSQLNISSMDNPDILKIDLQGDVEQLTWIIFQPKGAVISRLETKTKIDEIKISTLKKGNYVLMVKDSEGRILHTPFRKA